MLFAIVALGAAMLIGGLNFLPALALGPLVNHFFQYRDRVFADQTTL
jgi:K+-transporting ATPase A subunit